MNNSFPIFPITPLIALLLFVTTLPTTATDALLQNHCADCHNDKKAKGKFKLSTLGERPTTENFTRWLDALDLVTAGEMPPEDDSHLSDPHRAKLVAYLDNQIRVFHSESRPAKESKPRRLNNREFANSVRDVLLLEDIGTNQPVDNLIGDTLHHGFDTHSDTLGFSRFHLEQYIEAVRKIVDATILSGERPAPKRYEIPGDDIARQRLGQNTTRPIQYGADGHFDIRDAKLGALLPAFPAAPHTGRYTIKIRCTGKDRTLYATKHTGIYHGDPIQLSVHMGDRVRTFDLPDEQPTTIELGEWLAAGTRLELRNPTDGLSLRGNGNFKFQYAIAGDHIREHDPGLYARRAKKIENTPRKGGRGPRAVGSWQNWVDDWQGPRPRLFNVEIEGPLYDTWPPKRQAALLGQNPTAKNAAQILRPIAGRAWRRNVTTTDAQLQKITALVHAKAESLGDIGALKEGILAILVSPAFLITNTGQTPATDRFAAKLGYFLHSTIPDADLRNAVTAGQLSSFESIRTEIKNRIATSQADEFLREFPYAWLELNDINFMTPDPDHYRFYHRKRVSEDMVDEVLHFFRHAVENNIPVTGFLSADYSFINADLARVYGVENVTPDSRLRKHTFADSRRGGLLGMAAFLTATADSLATSPIHRAVYVMENFMGIHPTPPPPDVEIKEPDVRQAKTIKQILAAHTSDPSCASCHKAIDPWGYAFENFDPTGAWRDHYTVPASTAPDATKQARRPTTIPIDASAKFRNGIAYHDITDFRTQFLTDANRDRFVRCFIAKLLTYANGTGPTDADYVELNNILANSAEHDYRIIETIAAVIDSPLFREE